MRIVLMDRDGTLIIPPQDRRVDSPEKVKLFSERALAQSVERIAIYASLLEVL